jgi:hypothetical protein
MFNIRNANEKKQIEKTNMGVLTLNPISMTEMPNIQKAAASGILLSYLDTNQPERGNPIIELIGMNRRIVPSSASVNPNVVLMVGIRDAQLAKANPERK